MILIQPMQSNFPRLLNYLQKIEAATMWIFLVPWWIIFCNLVSGIPIIFVPSYVRPTLYITKIGTTMAYRIVKTTVNGAYSISSHNLPGWMLLVLNWKKMTITVCEKYNSSIGYNFNDYVWSTLFVKRLLVDIGVILLWIIQISEKNWTKV